MVSSLMNTVNVTANKISFWTKQHAPQILIVGGVTGMVGATVLACVATAKASEDIGEAQVELDAIEETKKTNDTYTDEEMKKDKRRVHMRLAGKLMVRYLPAAGVAVASGAGILMGANILNKRNAAQAMAISSLALKAKKLKNGLLEELGEEEGGRLYNKIIYGLEESEVKETVTDEKGKKVVKHKVKFVGDGAEEPQEISYVRRFDWTCPYYSDDPTYNLFFVRSQQNWANDKLRADGHIWMNTIDKALGFKETKAGQSVGWRYDPSDPYIDNFVDFNITEAYAVDDYGVTRPVIMIEYNVDGSILNKVDF